jgi:hypothetical protein
MTDLVYKVSTISDGSMLNRHDPLDPAVIRNREVFLKKHSITMPQSVRLHVNMLVRATVEHDQDYCRYREVTSKEGSRGMYNDDTIVGDAIVTRKKNVALFLPIADCVGATFYDPVQHVLMVSHLGRHSLEQQGGTKSVEFLVQSFGSNPADIKVWLTPAPGKDVYPIWKLDNKGMKEATFEQLDAAGILLNNITDNPADSTKDLNYYSYSEFLRGNREEDGDYAIVAMMR